MQKRYFVFILLFSLIVMGMQCTRKDIDFQSEPLINYFNLQPGKYIIYSLDSTVKLPFNDTAFTVRSYQAKDVVDQKITDNLGRESWRVYRYIRPASSTSEEDWRPDLTYIVTPTRETVEVVENNLRYQKLNLPIKEFFSWSGNKFLDNSDPLGSAYSFNNDNTMGGWEFYYESIDRTDTIENKIYDHVVTVKQVDEEQNFPIINPMDFGRKDYSVEKYARNIGLVYKELTMLEFQAANNVFPHGSKEGFSVVMRIIDHN
jgi:hypothetical protein